MPSDFSTVRNLFPSLQGLVSSPLKTLVSNPISAAKQKITAAQKPIKEKLRFFKSSTEDFPNLTGKLKNKIREYLEANRFYNLEPTNNDLKEKTIKQIHTDSETICDKYPLNLHANQEYVYPISLLQNRVITRPFFRESERAHNINLPEEIRKTIKEARTESQSVKQAIRDHLEKTIQNDTFVTTYVGNEEIWQKIVSKYPDKEARDTMLREKLLEPATEHLFKDVPGSTLVDLWKNAPQTSKMDRFRTATNRLLQPLYEEQRDFRLKPELRELIDKYFPFERLKLKPKFLPREHGLKHSLRLYLNNLKNYEPHLYNFCLNAARNINIQSPLPKDTKAFINIAVHQSETNLPHLLKILQQQDFNKNECPVYLFINGNDREQIQERLSEINTFIENQQNKPEQKLNVRVIAAELDHYRHGLKTIPLNLAYMDLALNHDFKKSDADVAAIYLDADILEFPSNDHISKLKNGILTGKIRNHDTFKWDFDKLTKLNVHYPIMHAFTQEYASIEHIFNQLNKIFNKNNYQTFADTGTANSGGHSSYSSILALLTGATKAHINNEDSDWSERASKVLFGSHLNSFYDLRHMYQAMTNNLPGVEMDEGALRRPMELNRPMRDIWTSHDLIQGDDELSPIDFSKPDELNLKRVKEELNILGKEIMKQGIKFGKTAFKEKYPGKLTHGIIADVLADSLRSLSQAIRQSPLVIEDKTKVLELIQRKLEEFFEYGMNE
jgi:hypothetical protein